MAEARGGQLGKRPLAGGLFQDLDGRDAADSTQVSAGKDQLYSENEGKGGGYAQLMGMGRRLSGKLRQGSTAPVSGDCKMEDGEQRLCQ